MGKIYISIMEERHPCLQKGVMVRKDSYNRIERMEWIWSIEAGVTWATSWQAFKSKVREYKLTKGIY